MCTARSALKMLLYTPLGKTLLNNFLGRWKDPSGDIFQHTAQVERREVDPEVVKHMDQKLEKLVRDAYKLVPSCKPCHVQLLLWLEELGQNTGISPMVILSMANVLTPIIGKLVVRYSTSLVEYPATGPLSSSSSEDEEEGKYEGK